MAMTDLIDSLLGIAPDSRLHLLRARRPEARQHAEGAWRELVLPADPGGVSLAERAAIAMRVAKADAALAAHYRALGPAPAEGDRMAVLLHHADLVATRPEAVGKPEITALEALGLTPRDIVAITQLVAFVPFQIRLLAGLRLLQQEAA